MTLKSFYLAAAILGTVIPWIMFGSFFSENGIDFFLFARSLYANGAAGGFSTDVMMSIFIFWVWSWTDAREHGIRR